MKPSQIIGGLEDDDDNDDNTSGICGWVLSFRNKPIVKRLFFNPAATTSAPLKPLTEARANRSQKYGRAIIAFAGEVVVIVVATLCCFAAATITEFKPELRNLLLSSFQS
jgi:hypothetical protein